MAGAFAPAEAPSPVHHWRLLVADRLLGAFDPGTSAAVMNTLWRAAATGGLNALVEAVPLRGAEAVASFAIATPGPSTTFVVRGGGCADVGVAGRIRRVDARGNEPWYVAELGGVDRFALGPLERAAGEVLPGPDDASLGQGVALGPWVGWTAPTAPPRTGEIPTATGDTNVLADLGRRAAALTRRRGEPPATSPTPETERAASFRVGARQPERVDAPVYIGRQPRSPRITGPVVPRLVRVESPSREVSATHVELRPTPHGLVLTDLQSTNGTVIRAPGHGVRRLASGESLAVPPGTLIDIGDGNVIEILPYR